MAPKTSSTASMGRSRSTVVPTNTVTTLEGKKVRARIDPTLSVADVVRQLCLNLEISQPPAAFALRDDHDQLVTDENLRRHIGDRTHLKLVRSPAADARDCVTNLTRSDSSLKMTLFNLQKFIREPQFAKEFVQRDGLGQLIAIIGTNHGNTLAYALTAMRNLMDYDQGWATIETSFIAQLCQILKDSTTPINVCRPATSILKKLVEADPRSAPGPAAASSSRSHPAPPAGSVWRYGFDTVWEQVHQTQGLLDVVVQRLGNAESGMALSSMTLINTLLSHSTDNHWEVLVAELERLNTKKAVTLLMSGASVEELASSILDFQANIIRVAYREKISPVDPDVTKVQDKLDFIWKCTRLDEKLETDVTSLSQGAATSSERCLKLGFSSEHVRAEFARVGMLGLDCLHSFAGHDTEYFAKVILEQLNRQPERRCPVAMASNEVVELLADHWSVYSLGYSTSTTYQPLFLAFNKVHHLATRFFLRMWNESAASRGDFARVVSVVQSQIKVALANESNRPWHEVESCFLEMQYREVRDRQLRELELRDELLSKPPVRHLRARLHQESYEFVRQQRILCLMQGAWFANGIPVPTGEAGSRDSLQLRKPTRPWRFYRLDRSHKWLHYVDSTVKVHIKPGLEDLPEKIEIAQISDIAVGTCASPPNIAMPEAHTPPSPFGTAPTASPLSFSIMISQGAPLADHVSENASRFSDWVDGLNMLKNSQITTRETELYVQTLTEIGLKIKLLDLSGEKVDIPGSLPASPPPTNTDYFFSEPTMFA